MSKPAAKLVTDAEVDRARNLILASIELSLNSSENVAQPERLGGQGDWRLMFLNRDRLRAQDGRCGACGLATASNRTAAVFYPTSRRMRGGAQVADVMALVKDYKGDAAKDAGVAFDATPENIEAHAKRSTLPGGLQFVLLPKNRVVVGGAGSRCASAMWRASRIWAVLRLSPPAADAVRPSTRSNRRMNSTDSGRASTNSWGSGMYAFVETTRENLPPRSRW